VSASELDESLAALFHENSKQQRHDRAFGWRVAAVGANPAFRQIASRPGKRYRGAEVVPLPPPATIQVGIGDAIRGRRSAHAFGSGPLSLEDIASLLFFGCGVTSSADGSSVHRAAPSAGGLHPTEVYVAVRAGGFLAPGAYHYRPNEHVLERLLPDPTAIDQLAHASSYPKTLESAATVFVLTTVLGRTSLKYGQRGYRFALLEAGHVAQNVLLVASALGLGAVPVGGFIDDEVHEILRIDGVDEVALYLIPVGQKLPVWDEPGWEEGQSAVAAAMDVVLSTWIDDGGGHR